MTEGDDIVTLNKKGSRRGPTSDPNRYRRIDGSEWGTPITPDEQPDPRRVPERLPRVPKREERKIERTIDPEQH